MDVRECWSTSNPAYLNLMSIEAGVFRHAVILLDNGATLFQSSQ